MGLNRASQLRSCNLDPVQWNFPDSSSRCADLDASLEPDVRVRIAAPEKTGLQRVGPIGLIRLD